MRLWSCGFELNTKADGMEWSDSFLSSASSLDTSVVHSGTYSYKVTAAGSADRDRFHLDFASTEQNGPYYARMYLRIEDHLTTGPISFITIYGNDGLSKGRIRLNSDGTLELWDGSVQIGSDSSALNLNTWYRIELKYYNNTGSGFTEVEGKIDGVTFASTTTGTDTGGVRKMNIGPPVTDTNYTIYIDDCALNDSSGSFQNSWCGAGNIVYLRPNNVGDNSAWSGDYADLDDTPPDDDPTHVDSNTFNQIEDVNLEATPAAIAGDAIINCVQVGARFKGVAGSANALAKLRIKAEPSGTVEESSEITPDGTNWRTNDPSAFNQNYQLTLYDLPGTSTDWTKSSLDTAQIGARISTGNTNAFQITAMWLLVDYAPLQPGLSVPRDSTDPSNWKRGVKIYP